MIHSRRINRPVKRSGAERYLMVTLVAFAGSVLLTRLFLWLTGYPQLGGNGLHIAHVLWGGLLLFLASILPLVFANRWAYSLGALLSGIGVGLFIDEVGKFITQNNDYFYPPAAPIIYAFFLLTALLYLRIKRPEPRDVRSELYRALDMMEEVLDHDLDPHERSQMRKLLRDVRRQAGNNNLGRLADALLEFIDSKELVIVMPYTSPWARLNRLIWRAESWLTERRLRLGLIAVSGVVGAAMLLDLLTNLGIYLLPSVDANGSFWVTLARYSRIELTPGVTYGLLALRVLLQGVIGACLVVTAALLLIGRTRRAIGLGTITLLVALTVFDLLLFYFNQFLAVSSAIYHLVLLQGLNLYERLHIPDSEGHPGQELVARQGMPTREGR